jgi:hypothetical protein
MRIYLVAVPAGGGEAEYTLTMEVPAIPQVGDYISVLRDYKSGPPSEDYAGSEDFIVRRVRWSFTYPDDGTMTHTAGQEPVGRGEVYVECEMAIGGFSSKAHKRSAGPNAMEHEASAY